MESPVELRLVEGRRKASHSLIGRRLCDIADSLSRCSFLAAAALRRAGAAIDELPIIEKGRVLLSLPFLIQATLLLGAAFVLTDTNKQFSRTFLLGLAAAIASSIAMWRIYRMSIAKRFRQLARNVDALSRGVHETAPLKGDDEAAVIDSAVHAMAKSLNEKSADYESFLCSVSHDLRSPLINLQGFEEEMERSFGELRRLITSESFDAEERNRALRIVECDLFSSLSFMRRSTERMTATVGALLKLSRAGRVPYDNRAVNTNRIVQDIVDSMDITVRRQQALVTIEPLPWLWGDEVAIEHLFSNLISNAVKYLSNKRPGRIRVFQADKAALDGNCVIAVTDNGRGIPPRFHSKLFVPFQRFHPEVKDGEGIGLALVERTITRLGGRIWFESEPDKGTTFFLLLPSVEPPTETVRPPTAQELRQANSTFW